MKILKISPVSITLKLENSFVYYNKNEFDIFLNDKFLRTDNRNVFTIFDLNPNTKYKINIDNEILEFQTLNVSNIYHIKDFIVHDDKTFDNTLSFQCAINALDDNGLLIIDEGEYFLKPIFFKSNISIYLKKDAKLIFETDRNKFPLLPPYKLNKGSLGTWQGDKDTCFASPISILNCKNVNFVGEGIIDCNALEGDWYLNHREKRIAWRPFGVFINNSNNISLVGLTIKNTPSWNLHPYFSSNLNFLNLSLLNPPSMPTTDGIDVDSCKNVNILGTYISVGDDCVVIKSGTYDFYKEFGKHPSKNILVENCLMEQGHGGVVFGSESSGGISNCLINKCLFKNTDRGFRLKTRRLRGNVPVEHIEFKNIKMEHVLTPFVINMFYNMGPNGGHDKFIYEDEQIKNDTTPVVKKFLFEDIVCSDVEIAAGVFLGLKESPIQELHFKNCSFSYKEDAKKGKPVMIEFPFELQKASFYLKNVDKLVLENVTFNHEQGDMTLLNVRKVVKDNG